MESFLSARGESVLNVVQPSTAFAMLLLFVESAILRSILFSAHSRAQQPTAELCAIFIIPFPSFHLFGRIQLANGTTRHTQTKAIRCFSLKKFMCNILHSAPAQEYHNIMHTLRIECRSFPLKCTLVSYSAF